MFALPGVVNDISKALGGAAIAFDGVALVKGDLASGIPMPRPAAGRKSA
jgi:hypothetical protein